MFKVKCGYLSQFSREIDPIFHRVAGLISVPEVKGPHIAVEKNTNVFFGD